MKRSDYKVLEQFANRTMEKIVYNGFKRVRRRVRNDRDFKLIQAQTIVVLC